MNHDLLQVKRLSEVRLICFIQIKKIQPKNFQYSLTRVTKFTHFTITD
jgi:hypothetical protein